MSTVQDLVPDFSFVNKYFSPSVGVDTQICQLNSSRFALCIVLNVGGGCNVQFSPMGAVNRGWVLSAAQPFLWLNFRDHPGIVCSDWFARPSGAGVSLTVWELIYRPRER